MKNRHFTVLVSITCLFAAFCLGFLWGRSTAPGDTIISRLPEPTQATAPLLQAAPTSPETTVTVIPTETPSTVAGPTFPATEATTAPVETPAPAPTATEAPPAATEPPVPVTTPATEPTVPLTTPVTEPSTQPPVEENSGLININTATLAQLDTLPGIGPVLAQRIIDYRQAHGPFTSVSQLILVNGIGEKKLAAIIGLITI